MKIVITGLKAVGKSTIGAALSRQLRVSFIDVDDITVRLALGRGVKARVCADVYRQLGAEEFRNLERQAVREAAASDWCVIATGGSSLLDAESRRQLRPDAVWFFLDAPDSYLWDRLSNKPLPAFLENVSEPRQEHARRSALLREVILPHADYVVRAENRSVAEISDEIAARLCDEMAIQSRQPNTLGSIIRLTTFGESHGPVMGAVLDGIRPGLELDASDIQRDLDRRRPGQSQVTTQRAESDKVEIVSGVFDGKTTGSPIAMLIRNADTRSAHYEAIKDVFRPGHADLTFWRKYGIRDYRGGGRSSGRETVSRVAGGAVARKILGERGAAVKAYTIQIGQVEARNIDLRTIEDNPVRCPDAEAARKMVEVVMDARQRGDSVGGIVQAEILGLPAGLGDPVFGKLDARLAMALFSIGAVKGVEFGAGFRSAGMFGSQNNDQMAGGRFMTNNAGGILGGISTGQPVVIRIAVKPTPSVSKSQKTCDTAGHDRDIQIEGRHDPCIVPRIIPVIEAMISLVLLDAWEIQERLHPGWLDADDAAESRAEKP